MPAVKNCRHGHRERVRARFLREGLSSFADYEVIELLLFYAIPRKDTKQEAHALADRFGSLYGVLTASVDALQSVPGIGARTAEFLHSLYPLAQYVAKEEPHDAPCLDWQDLAERVYPFLKRGVNESASLVFLNNRDEVICVEHLGEGKTLNLISGERIACLAISYGASSLVLADYKKVGIPFPDPTVLQGARTLQCDLSTLGVHLRDYLFFTDTQYNSYHSLVHSHQLSANSYFCVEHRETPMRYPKTYAALEEVLSFAASPTSAAQLATELLDKYRTLSILLSVPYETLLSEHPDEEREIFVLKLFFELCASVGVSHAKCEKEKAFSDATVLGEMFCDAIGMNGDETVAVAMFDRSMRFINMELCARGTVNTAAFVTRRLVKTAVSSKAAFVAVAHNHPNGESKPSTNDIAMTVELYHAFHRVGIGFVDHFVVTSAESVPVSRYEGMAEFTDMDASFYKDTPHVEHFNL